MTREGRIVRFGVFEVDLAAGELRKSGLRIKLQDQPFQILAMLLERAGEVVNREELSNRLWPDGTFVDFDHSLNASVNKLREALGDSASNVRFIETVPRRGYRFVAPVERPEPPPANELPPVEKPRRKMIAAGAATAIVIAASGVAIWQMQRMSAPSEPLWQVIPLTSEPGLEVQPTFSPDGHYVAYVSSRPGSERAALYVKQIGSETVRRLSSGPVVSPKWSPDGRYIAFVRILSEGEFVKAAVQIAPALGGAERSVPGTQIGFQVVTPFLIDWFGDSVHMVIADQVVQHDPENDEGTSLFVVNTRTGERWRITTRPPGGIGDRDPAVSPDGRQLAFSRYTGNPFSSEIYIMDLNAELRPAGEPRLLTSQSGSRAPAWMPSGSEIVFASGPQHRKRLWRMRVNDGSRPQPLPFAVEGSLALSAAISRHGQIAYPIFRWDVDIYRTELHQGSVGRRDKFLSSTFVDHTPEYSPDGQRIAFVSNRSGAQEIWISASDGSNPYQLTSFRGNPEITRPRWSPDGSRLVFAGGRSVYVIDFRGGQPVLLVKDLTSEGVADWSLDGKWIHVNTSRTGQSEVWKVPVDGDSESKWVQITRNGGGPPKASPDGKFIYYTKGATNAELWRVPVEGGNGVRVIDSLSNDGAFAVTRQGVYFIPYRAQNEPTSIEFLDSRTNVQRTIAPVNGTPMWGLAVSPDERSILHVAMAEEPESDLMLVENFR